MVDVVALGASALLGLLATAPEQTPQATPDAPPPTAIETSPSTDEPSVPEPSVTEPVGDESSPPETSAPGPSAPGEIPVLDAPPLPTPEPVDPEPTASASPTEVPPETARAPPPAPVDRFDRDPHLDRSHHAQQVLFRGRGLTIASATLFLAGAGMNMARPVVYRDDTDASSFIGLTIGTWMVNSSSIVLAGVGGRDLGLYYAPARSARALNVLGAVVMTLGLGGSAVLRFSVPIQGLAAAINGTDGPLSRSWYYASLQGCTLLAAGGAGMLGFGNNGRGAQLVLRPELGPRATGLLLAGRF